LLRVNTELGKRGLGQVVCPIRVESVRSLERLDAEQRKAREVAAFDAMCAARPLKPPPTKFLVPIMTAAQVALKRDVKLGAYVPTHAWSQL
jgi:hypothetical protein